MNMSDIPQPASKRLFDGARWYDESVNWAARFAREMPVFETLFGSPGEGGIIDAGCGPGRHAAELSRRGYRVVGVDASEEMLAVATTRTEGTADRLSFQHTTYGEMAATIGVGFDGLYCVGNSLAAAGSAKACAEAIAQFGLCLRPGGRMLVQILNFAAMRAQSPCIKGPRVTRVGDREYISVRQFHFFEDAVQVTNITLYDDGGWQQRSSCGSLYAISRDELHCWCADARLKVDETWGDYSSTPLDLDRSTDLIVTATRERSG